MAADLTEFLLARIAEDQAAAVSAKDHWFLVDANGSENAAHYYHQIPERVLADCAAKRRVIAWCSTPDPHTSDEAADIPCTECGVLYMLALRYADHPDYDESWR